MSALRFGKGGSGSGLRLPYPDFGIGDGGTDRIGVEVGEGFLLDLFGLGALADGEEHFDRLAHAFFETPIGDVA